jgi:uncharacterized membrane protein
MDQHSFQAATPPSGSAKPAQRTNTRVQLIRTGVVVFALLVVSSYIFKWTWTGFSDNTLWQWLNLLLVPIASAAVPFWFSSRPHWRPEWTTLLVFLVAFFLILVIGSYLFHWGWTGFSDNTLWQWMNLLLLPLALTASKVWFSVQPQWRPQWTRYVMIALIVFALLVLSSYLFKWKWTGFSDNTLWEWLNLLVLPFALPAAIAWLSTQQNTAKSHVMSGQYPPSDPQALQGAQTGVQWATQTYAESYLHDGKTIHSPSVSPVKHEEANASEETVFLHPEVPLERQGEQGIEGL